MASTNNSINLMSTLCKRLNKKDPEKRLHSKFQDLKMMINNQRKKKPGFNSLQNQLYFKLDLLRE